MNPVRLFPLDGAQRPHPNVERWFSETDTPLRTLAREWFEAMRSCGPDVTELLHDGHPTACVDGMALGYVNAFRSHVNVGFFLGATLEDPARLLQGTGKFMRHVKLSPADAVHEVALKALVTAAYADLKARLAAYRPPGAQGSPSAA